MTLAKELSPRPAATGISYTDGCLPIPSQLWLDSNEGLVGSWAVGVCGVELVIAACVYLLLANRELANLSCNDKRATS